MIQELIGGLVPTHWNTSSHVIRHNSAFNNNPIFYVDVNGEE